MSNGQEHDHAENGPPAFLLQEYADLIWQQAPPGPILDLACGDGRNGIFLAKIGWPVILCDVSEETLARAGTLAAEKGVAARLWKVDLEKEGINPLAEEEYAVMLVFRYLHRPLIPCIRKGLKKQGLLVYETFTRDQLRFGKPHNPNYLLKPGELKGWFSDWEIIYYDEGIKPAPERAVAQIVCRKPG